MALWPDTDEQGRKHMERIAERLQPIAAEVLLYEWHDAPVVKLPDGKLKAQDAADHPAIRSRNSKAVDWHLTAAHLYSLLQYLVPNKKVQGGKCALIGA